ncbi:MAG: hotdog fold thioesterase [Deltaproteobacteria bacterium]|nr:hotdog fold thioesterase [Deltaproteobacteria bacterium]
MGNTHFRKLERMYASAPINRFFRPALKISAGEAELVIPVGGHLFHAANAVHGSVYAKAVDDAAFFAANSLVKDVFVLTVHLDVSLTRPVSSGEIRAKGRVTFSSRNLFHAETVLSDREGRELGRGSGIFVRGKTPLTPAIGYR